MNDLGATTGIEHGDHRHARVLGDVRPLGGAGRDGGACGGIRTVSDCSVAVPVATTVALFDAAPADRLSKLPRVTSLDRKPLALKVPPACAAMAAAGLAVSFTMH